MEQYCGYPIHLVTLLTLVGICLIPILEQNIQSCFAEHFRGRQF